MQASHLRRKLGDTAGCEVLAKILAAQGGVQEGLEHSPIEVRIDAVEVRRLEPGHKLLQRLMERRICSSVAKIRFFFPC